VLGFGWPPIQFRAKQPLVGGQDHDQSPGAEKSVAWMSEMSTWTSRQSRFSALFLGSEGRRLHPDNFVKRQLKPILKKLRFDGAAHAFRHGNASLLDHLAAPIKVRQDRLGHADPRTTMGYTHVIGDDHRKVAEQLGGFFAQVRLNLPKKENGSGEESSQAAV
jgi:site-specific recombinase XerC